MGTNYYHRTAICECCARYEEAHICKSMISFEAIVEWPDTPPYGPVVVVGSWQDWKSRLLAEGEVWDEYGRHWDTERFIEDVEATAPEHRRRQYDWMRKDYPEELSLIPLEGKYWLDADGFSFSGRPFS